MQQLTKKQYMFIGTLCLIGVCALAYTVYTLKQANLAVDEETKAIFSSEGRIIYTDIEGREVSLEEYLGRKIVVTSWASWSPFSAKDLTALNELAREKVNEGVVFMAINRKEQKEQAVRYLATLPELSNLLVIIDTEDRFYNSVGGYAMPETVVFDEQGKIVLHDRGVLDIERVTASIQSPATAD